MAKEGKMQDHLGLGAPLCLALSAIPPHGTFYGRLAEETFLFENRKVTTYLVSPASLLTNSDISCAPAFS